jgi:energy-coupling factor transporter transmembrane protein EcfT
MILLIILLFIAFLLQPFWWWILVLPFLYGLVSNKTPLKAMSIGMISCSIVWGAMALYHYFTDAKIVVGRIAAMMEFEGTLVLVVYTILIALLCGGAAALAGRNLRLFLNSGNT